MWYAELKKKKKKTATLPYTFSKTDYTTRQIFNDIEIQIIKAMAETGLKKVRITLKAVSIFNPL